MQLQRERHAAYVAVFGPPNQPTPHGAIVLADLERFARFAHSATYRPRVGKQPGPVDPYGTLYNLGLQDFVKRIHQWLTWSDNDDSNPGPDGQ